MLSARILRPLLFLPLIAVVLLCPACRLSGPDEEDMTFSITVVDEQDRPISGVTITGGSLQAAFRAVTDASGRATLPMIARNEPATFLRTNFLPLRSMDLRGDHYQMSAAPSRLSMIGVLKGRILSFHDGYVQSLENSGMYHYCRIQSSGVTELTTMQVIPTGAAVDAVALEGPHLWIVTQGTLLHLDVSVPAMPRPVGSMQWPWACKGLAVQDSLMACITGDRGQVILCRLRSSSAPEEVSRITSRNIRDLRFLGSSLVILGTSLPQIVDVRNPETPVPSLRASESTDDWNAMVVSDTIYLMQHGFQSGVWTCRMKPLSASDVSTIRTLHLPFPITGFLSSLHAYGPLADGSSMALYSLSATPTLISVLTVPDSRVQGAAPPYFFIDDRVWMVNN